MNHLHVADSTTKLTLLGIMSAITIILVYTPLGMIPLPFVSLTIAHIPTIMLAILAGPIAGTIMGFIFGVATLIRALTLPSGILDPLFINPLVSVLPRLFVGIVAYSVYKVGSRINGNVGILAGAIAGSLTNTIGCLGMLYIIYPRQIVANFGGTAEAFVLAVIISSGLPEMVVAIVISFPIIKTLKKITAR